MVAILGTPQVSQALLKDIDRVGRKHRQWTKDAYFELDGAYVVEFCRGRLEILPMPTTTHQRVAQRMNYALLTHVHGGAARGEVYFAGTRVKVGDDIFREPDVLFVPEQWRHLVHEQFVEKAALVVEVISEFNRRHDVETKRTEYEEAGIPEYWLIDPEKQLVTVLTLGSSGYVEHGVFGPSQRATSVHLAGFSVDVATLFAA
jgi:Uma2 family endonuclease